MHSFVCVYLDGWTYCPWEDLSFVYSPPGISAIMSVDSPRQQAGLLCTCLEKLIIPKALPAGQRGVTGHKRHKKLCKFIKKCKFHKENKCALKQITIPNKENIEDS